MKALKTIFIILLALVGIILVLGLLGKKEYRVERSLVIPASASVVYANVSDLNNHAKWSPWREMDPDMKEEVTGEPGSVGQKASWSSNNGNVGNGSQEIIALGKDKMVRTALVFTSPWESTSTGTFDLVEENGGTKVVWGVEGENAFMMRVMSMFMDMDGMVGPQFEKGLAKLSSVCAEEQSALEEKMSKEYGGFTIETVERPAMAYVGKRKKMGWSEMKDFYEKTYPAVFKATGGAGVAPAGAPVGLFFDWNEETQSTDMFAGVPVQAGDVAKARALNGMVVEEVPAGKAFQIVYQGGYNGSGKAHEAMDMKLKADGAETRGVAIEEYLVGPSTEPDSNNWKTLIIYPLK